MLVFCFVGAKVFHFPKLLSAHSFHSLLWHLFRFESDACLLVADGTSWRQRVSHNSVLNLRAMKVFCSFSSEKRVFPYSFVLLISAKRKVRRVWRQKKRKRSLHESKPCRYHRRFVENRRREMSRKPHEKRSGQRSELQRDR